MHWCPASLVLDLREWTLRSDRQPGQGRLATCAVQGGVENAQDDRGRTDADTRHKRPMSLADRDV